MRSVSRPSLRKALRRLAALTIKGLTGNGGRLSDSPFAASESIHGELAEKRHKRQTNGFTTHDAGVVKH